MWWLWIVGYLGIATVTGLLYARSSAKELIADPSKFRLPKRDDSDYDERLYSYEQKPRSEVDRIQRCAESVFWESWWIGILWPICGAAVLVMGGHSLITTSIVGKELKEARKKDEAEKTKKILEAFERDQREKFKKELGE